MNKLYLLFVLPAFLLACGGSDEESDTSGSSRYVIDTKDLADFSGSLQLSEDEIANEMPYNNNGENGWSIDLKDGATLAMYPSDSDFSAAVEARENSNFGDAKTTDKGDNWAFFEITNGDETEYNFVVVVEWNDRFIHLEGNGENPIADLKSEKQARKLLDVAQTFKLEK